MMILPNKPYKFNYIDFDFPNEKWEKKAYMNLRKEVFCEEQKVFEENDIDLIDQSAIPIAAYDECMGIVHNVVGAVRIDERTERTWWGSRLCVHKDYRTHTRFQTSHLFQDQKDVNPIFALSIGAALIYKAVTTANYLGCDHFYAHVQAKNKKFFSRLHWEAIEEVEVFGFPHYLMKADLSYYPATPYVETIRKVS